MSLASHLKVGRPGVNSAGSPRDHSGRRRFGDALFSSGSKVERGLSE